MKFGIGSYFCDRPCDCEFYRNGNNYCCCRAPAVLHATWATNNPTCFALCYNLPTVIPFYCQAPLLFAGSGLPVGPAIDPALDPSGCTIGWLSDGYAYGGIIPTGGQVSFGWWLQFLIQCVHQGDYQNTFSLWIMGFGGACKSPNLVDGRYICRGSALGGRYTDPIDVANARSRVDSCNPVHLAFPPVLLCGEGSDGPQGCTPDMTFPTYPLGVPGEDLLTLELTSVT